MQWSEILAGPSFRDLPYKGETNQYGQVVLSPASNEHGDLQQRVCEALRGLRAEGRVSVESSVSTAAGGKDAGVTLRCDEFQRSHAGENPFSAAPELCVEVLSPANSRRAMGEKRSLYLAAGAIEVGECDLAGEVRFYDPSGEIDDSRLFPGFPKKVG